MTGFKDFEFDWRGEGLRVPAKGLLLAIDEVEGVVTIGELAEWYTTGRIRYKRLAEAMSVLLRHAGKKESVESLYLVLYGVDEDHPEGRVAKLHSLAMSTILALQSLMVPPVHLQSKVPATEGKPGGDATPDAPSAATTG